MKQKKGVIIKKKVRTGTMLYPKTIKLADNNIVKANVSSRNDFIEKAINFYVGYLNTQENIEFINEIIGYTIQSKLDLFEESLSSLLFKLSVQLDMLTHILAANFDIDEETLKKLREKSTLEVQETIGTLNLEDIFKEHTESEE